MSKMIRVKEDTYALLMEELGREQSRHKKRLSVDSFLKVRFGHRASKGRKDAWAIIDKAVYNGPKTDCVKESNLVQ